MVQRSFLQQLKDLGDRLEQVQPVFLEKVATHLTQASPNPSGQGGGSPVDTGAYVMSHSIGTSSGLGGRQSSAGRPKDYSEASREAAFSKLMTQIAGLPPDATKVYIGNRSPHASYVEYGTSRYTGYYVYETAKNKAPVWLQEAKRELGFQ
jgi:hypothetical protein